MQKQSIGFHELFQNVLLEVHAAWRYRWQALIIAWCVAIVGALLVFSLPNQYQSSAQVYADTDALTNPLLRGLAVQPDLGGRLDVITRTLLARPNLETVADKAGLLEKLGSEVKVKDGGAKNLYNISYTDPDKKMAQKVVQAFVQILMNDTLGENNAATASAQNFLEQQVKDYNNRLNEAERRLSEFRKANMGYLPGPAGSDYSTRLQLAEAKLQDLESQYAAAASGSPSAIRRVDPRIRALDQQIAAYQQQLDKLLLSYTNAYPDVVSTRRALAQLKAQRAALLAHPGRGSGALADSDVAAASPAARGDRLGTRFLAAQIAAQKQQIADL